MSEIQVSYFQEAWEPCAQKPFKISQMTNLTRGQT